LGALVVASGREETIPPNDAELLQQITKPIAVAVENALAFGRVAAPLTSLREHPSTEFILSTVEGFRTGGVNPLVGEKLYLEHETHARSGFEEIIGERPALTRVLEQVEMVAFTDSTVLIQGETGTGKELIARAIHKLSHRSERAFVKVNCAAIPMGLLESELFGHEKGAFTGAIAQRIGRFELANAGTLFLDEVEDIPLELQPKLLRVLQEQEFERLGSAKTMRVDVRMVAATNADLAEKVATNQFRRDLYYRLNILSFPL
jgi:formate hydrogenlyase transcriptional activator